MSRTPGRIVMLLLALVAAAGGALQAQPAGESAAPAPARRTADASLVRALQDHEWTLNAATDAAGKPVEALLVPGHPFVVRFDGARIAVRGGCNLLSGRWRLSPHKEIEDDRLTLFADCDL